MILKRDVRGVITSIPPKRLALRGKMSTAAIAMTTPRAATNEPKPVAAVALPVLVGGEKDACRDCDDTPKRANQGPQAGSRGRAPCPGWRFCKRHACHGSGPP